MQQAFDQRGALISADAKAPRRARCPHCGAVVILRKRRRSKQPGDVTYFWRHQDQTNIDCPGRFQGGRQARAQTSRYSRRHQSNKNEPMS